MTKHGDITKVGTEVMQPRERNKQLLLHINADSGCKTEAQ